MKTNRITEEDFERMYAVCTECNKYVTPLEAGLELDFLTCEKCGVYGVATEDQFNKLSEV